MRTSEGWTAIDSSGRVAFPPQSGLSLKGPYSGGLIRVERGGKAGYLDRRGQMVWPQLEGGRS